MTADKTFLLKTVFRESAKGKAVLQEFTRFFVPRNIKTNKPKWSICLKMAFKPNLEFVFFASVNVRSIRQFM